jgi:hypothetical protein
MEEHPAASRRRPDFAVVPARRRRASLYVECVAPVANAMFGPGGPLEAVVLDVISSIANDKFSVMLGSVTPGTQLPRKAEITTPIVKWLDGLDHAEIVRLYSEGIRPRPLRLRVRGWSVDLTPRPRTARSPGPARLISVGPVYTGFANDVRVIRQALVAKARRYGRLDAPFIISVLGPTPWGEEGAGLEVLYGSEVVRVTLSDPLVTEATRNPDGFWWPMERPKISGVLLGGGLNETTFARAWPELWLNPRAASPLPRKEFPLPVASLNARGYIDRAAPLAESPLHLFGLNEAWSGLAPWG